MRRYTVYKYLLRNLLFLFQPETAHNLTFLLIRVVFKLPFIGFLIKKAYAFGHPALEREVFGIRFPNPVGLAAGLDKDAKLTDEFGSLGFGFVEIGTITPEPQPGNSKPRLFRIRDDKGLINRMGFNNSGAVAAAERLKKRKSRVIVGGNIGKNKWTENEQAILDYETCFNRLFDHVDYFAVNVSSPNTPGLRELQEKEPLKKILSRLQALNRSHQEPKPVLLKIAPDLSLEQLDDIIEIVREIELDGVIATNTTIERSGLTVGQKKVNRIGAGGLSGKPLRDRSTEVIRYLFHKSGGAFPIIGAGGIMSADDAIEKLKAGASLIQIYTGLIYEGPALIKKINKRIYIEGI